MRTLVVAPLLAALAGGVHAAPLSFDAALEKAEQAPLVEARNHEIEGRHAALDAAGRLPDPKLGLALENYPVSGPTAWSLSGEPMTMARLGIAQEVPNRAGRMAARSRARADLLEVETMRDADIRQARAETALAWLDLHFADRRLSLIDSLLGGLKPLTPGATASVSAGTRATEAIDYRQTLARIEDRRATLAAERAGAKARLARWSGEADPEAAGPPPEFAVSPAALKAALDAHPDRRAVAARVSQAEADVAAARAAKRPDWGWEVAFQRRDRMYGDMVSAGVTVSLPLFAKHRQDPLIAARVSAAAAALAGEADVRRALAAGLDEGLAAHATHREQWLRARDTLLPLARQRAEQERASYAAGRAGLVDVIRARAMFADAEMETLDREATVMRDAARLALTYGRNEK